MIDSVLLPESQARNIPDVAAEAGSFQTLLTAVKAAGLSEVLNGTGPYTVFAPNDEAFAKLPQRTLQELLKAKNRSKLAAILNYHVVAGKVSARQATTAGFAATLVGPKRFHRNSGWPIASQRCLCHCQRHTG